LGAFTTSKLEKYYRESSNNTSFIFTFSKKDKITFYPISYSKDQAKSLTYDEYFLIVGNSEIRLRFGQMVVYSNYGISNAYYETRGDTVDTLLM
jgi:hypothetical protein